MSVNQTKLDESLKVHCVRMAILISFETPPSLSLLMDNTCVFSSSNSLFRFVSQRTIELTFTSFSENIHLKPYTSEADFYERIYPLYLALLDKAKVFMEETEANPARTIVFISAGFDACEWEHQGMQRHDRRVPVSLRDNHDPLHIYIVKS